MRILNLLGGGTRDLQINYNSLSDIVISYDELPSLSLLSIL